MSSLRAWLRGTSASTPKASAVPSPADSSLALSGPSSSSTTSGNGGKAAISPAQQEISDVEDAMAAAALIMNDDIDGAVARLRLRNETSSFHQLGMGVSTFMRSILGFEKEIMAEAAACLAECEARAWTDMKKAQKEAEGMTGGGSWFGRGSGSVGAGGNGHVGGRVSQFYPPGSEFALVHAEAQLMNAMVAVMHESLTEGIKGFYKLRKAFITLDGIMAAEAAILKRHAQASGKAAVAPDKPPMSDDMMPGSFDGSEFAGMETGVQDETSAAGKESDSDLEFVDAAEGISGMQTPASFGPPQGNATAGPPAPATPAIEKQLADLALTASAPSSRPHTPVNGAGPFHSRNTSAPSLRIDTDGQTGPRSPPSHATAPEAFDPAAQRAASALFTNPIDIFVHSGANMCFGILLLLISMVPPAFSRLLSIIGFKGDRNRGLRMLWQSTRFRNVNGAVAGLILLGYYNGLLAFADILPTERDVEELAGQSGKTFAGGSTASAPEGGSGSEDNASETDEIVGYPRRRCTALLADMRAQYPASGLWRLEEARVQANSRDLTRAIAMLRANRDTKMRQITALNNFELSIDAMSAQDWSLMRDSFLKCIELNDWSHSLYYYMAGCAEVEMYREGVAAARRAGGGAGLEDAEEGDKNKEQRILLDGAKAHKKRAEEYFRKSPTCAGRKRFMARQMPLETFVCRKVAKLEERATALDVDLADAVAVSPAMEMIWLWNGSKRMVPELLEKARLCLDWGRCTVAPEVVDKMKTEVDEVAIREVCDASLLRQLGRLGEARDALDEVVKLDRAAFKGGNREDYVLPAAHYELAAIAWREACDRDAWPKASSPEEVDVLRRTKLDECQATLDKVAKWENFVLEARIGMRVKVGLESVQWLKSKKGWF